MERLFVLLLVLCAAVGLASAGRLVRLNDDNLERHFGESIGKDWVILFGNKKTTDPELVQTFQAFAEAEGYFVVGAVDCHYEPDLCLDYEISKRSGPVIMLVTAAGDRIKYSGEEQTPEAWKEWAYKVRHGSVAHPQHLERIRLERRVVCEILRSVVRALQPNGAHVEPVLRRTQERFQRGQVRLHRA